MKKSDSLKLAVSFNSIVLIFLFNVLLLPLTVAQTGPGGVGLQEDVVVWLKASDGVTYDGSNVVTSWTDQSAFGHVATQANVAWRPSYVADGGADFNNQPVLRFNDDFLTIPDDNSLDGFAQGVTIFAVIKATGHNDFQGVVAKSAAFGIQSAYNMYIRDDGDLRMRVNNGGADAQSLGSGVIGASTYVLSGVYDPVVKKSLAIYYNSQQSDTDADETAALGSYSSGLNIGTYAPANNSSCLRGDIAEIIIYNKGLKNAERLIIENYLGEKYGITISTDIFGVDAGYTPAYFYSFTGIGEESDGGVNSSNSAGFYISENGSTQGIGEYITFAHNNTVNAVVTSDISGSVDARWARDWWVEKSTGANVNVNMTFDLQEGIPGGQYPQDINNYVLLYRSTNSGNYSVVTATPSIGDADQVVFDVLNANLQNGYYTIGTTDQVNSPVEGQAGVTWYTLISGDWDNWETWTLDPSGSLPNNPGRSYPQNLTDNVVIKDGKTVTMNLNNIHCASLKIDGRLDLLSSSGHTFDKIDGSGRILMAADNFPSFTDNSGFVDKGQDEGTVVYYGNSFSLNTSYTFCNMEVNMTDGQTLTLLNDYILNGSLTVINGAFQINNNSTVQRKLTVGEDLIVNPSGTIRTGTGNPSGGYHQVFIKGNFTNNGTALFTNRTIPGYTTTDNTGAVEVIFNSAIKNQTVLCNGETRFNQLTCDKGTDETYILDVSASNVNNFKLFGRNNQGVTGDGENGGNRDGNKALRLLAGTLKLGSNIVIPELADGNSYDIDTDARLWLYANASVTIDRANWLAVYGTLQCSDNAVFNEITGSGTVLRGRSTLKFEGGTHNLNTVRTSTWGGAGDHLGAYIQSGGTVNVVNEAGNYASFHLPFQTNVFHMSGGTLRITDQGNSGGGDDFAMIVNSSDANSNVTGGTVIIDVAQNVGTSYLINLRAPVWNLILRNTYPTTYPIEIEQHTAINNDTETMAAMPLRVLNDLIIEGANNTTFNTNNADVSIGRNFRIEEGANYNFGTNTTTFNGTENAELYIGYSTPNNGYEQHFYNLIVDKPADKGLVLKGDLQKTAQYQEDNGFQHYIARLVHVENALEVKSGTFDQGQHSIRLFGPLSVKKDGQCGVYEAGVTHLYALIMLKDADINIETEDGAIFGNVKLNPSPSTDIISFSSDVYIKRISYFHGRINLGTNNLKVDYLHSQLTTSNYGWKDGRASDEMIYSSGNASDGGLTLKITGDGTYGFPIGVPGKYTPASLTVTNFVDDGYVTINPVDTELQTTNLSGGNLLNYYWRVNHEGFTALPTAQYRFKYDNSDIVGAENTYYPGKVLDENPYTRSYENRQQNVVDNSNEIIFNDYSTTSGGGQVSDTRSGFTLENANYTAGQTGRFTGNVEVYYNKRNNGGTWHNASDWFMDEDETVVATDYPKSGDVAVIRGDNYNDNITVQNNETCAEVRFVREGTYVDIESLPRLRIQPNAVLNAAKISGVGDLYMQHGLISGATVNADIGEFAKNENSVVEFYTTQNGIYNVDLVDFFAELPTLRIYGQGNTSRYVSFNYDLKCKNLVVDGEATLYIGGNYNIENLTRLGFTNDGRIRFPNGNTSYTFTTGSFLTKLGKDSGSASEFYRVDVEAGNSFGLEHRFVIKENIDLEYWNNSPGDAVVLDFYNSINENKVILEVTGIGEHSLNNSFLPAQTTIDLYRIIVNKGNSIASSFTMNNSFFVNGTTSGIGVAKAIELQNGLLVLNDASININLTTGDDHFEIPSTAGLELRSGTANANGNSGITLDGTLNITGGTLDMRGGDNPIIYSSSGNAIIGISSGNLYVGSQVRRDETSGEGVLQYLQSGGIVEIGQDAAGVDRRGIFEVLNPGSSFTHTAGSFTLVNDLRANRSVASFYFDPETVSLDAGTEFIFGNLNTTIGGKDFTIYGGKALQNLTINNAGSNNPTLTSSVVPLVVNGHMVIGAGTTFNANGLDLTVNGNYNNAGVFISNSNTSYFSGVTDQLVTSTGTGEFYNLYKTTGNTFTIANNITVKNELHLTGGVFNDGGNSLFAKGDMNISITTQSAPGGDGIVACGTAQQQLVGSSTLAALKIDNPEGVKVPVGNQITIAGNLIMNKGVFDIDQNLLVVEKNATITEASSFSETNMIQTNISFTDAGIKKIFPAIGAATDFVYPIGSQGKYTPVALTIRSINDGASIRVKAADEHQPTVQEGLGAMGTGETNNVLQYYWILDAEATSGIDATAIMQAYINDELVTPPNSTSEYITARLRSRASGIWEKYGDALNNDYNESTHELTFTLSGGDDQVDGDYTAGIDDAIPDQVAQYVSQNDGDWSTATTWLPNIAGGPRGARVLVRHEVTMDDNYKVSYETRIDNAGKLKIDQSYGHRLGNVIGTGTLYLERGDMPAGEYAGFFAPDSGRVEYGYTGALDGNEDYDILSSVPSVNTVIVSGAGIRRLPNIELQLHGNLVIGDMVSGPQLINEHSQKLNIKKDLEFNNGTYTSKTNANCIINFNGVAAQYIKGMKGFTATNTSALFNVEINNANGVTLNNTIEIAGSLTFGSGIINSTDINTITITNITTDCVIGATNYKYVNGPLYKSISSGDEFNFPVGKDGRYGNVLVKGTSHNGIWEAEYYNNSASNEGYDVTSTDGNVEFVSHNEYWRIKAPATGNSANLLLRWDNASGVSPDDNLRIVKWTDLAVDAWSELEIGTTDGDANNGTADLAEPITYGFSGANNNQYITFGFISIPQFTWLGNDQDWFKSTNWVGGAIPGAGVDIIVNNAGFAPVINTSSVAQVHNLTINHTGGLTLQPGSQMTVNGNLVTNDKLFIENTNASPASLITHGTVTGNVSIQWVYDELRWWFIGHSISNPQMDSYRNIPISDPGNKYVLYDYEDPGTLIKISDNSLYNFSANDELRGYQLKVLKPGTGVNHSGPLNNSAVYEKAVQTGWQVIANPYASYYQLPTDPAGSGDFSKTAGSVYVTVSTSNKDKVYETFNTNSGISSPGTFNGIIAPSQAFYIKTIESSTPGDKLYMRASNRVHDSNKSSLKSVYSSESNLLRVKISNEYDLTDEAVIALRADGDTSITRRDSEQRFMSGTDISYIYSIVGGIKTVINVLPQELNTYQQPLGVQLKEGKQEIKIEGLDQLLYNYDIVLEDKVAGVLMPMTSQVSYEFTGEAGTFDDRFVLHFNKIQVPTGTNDLEIGESDVNVYIQDKSTLQVICNWDAKEKTVSIFTITGQEVLNQTFEGETLTEHLALKTGIYIVQISGAGKTYEQKVFVR